MLCIHQNMHCCLFILCEGSSDLIVSASVFTDLQTCRLTRYHSLLWRKTCICYNKEQEESLRVVARFPVNEPTLRTLFMLDLKEEHVEIIKLNYHGNLKVGVYLLLNWNSTDQNIMTGLKRQSAITR